ncbi:hypothetical protein VNO77_15991 [Canavalia gladiata]|uniref:Uncharacterized protein n=1 Tax=Canavalia gladiata TaxID=3824 RepID=A0AAN9M072_CANGL
MALARNEDMKTGLHVLARNSSGSSCGGQWYLQSHHELQTCATETFALVFYSALLTCCIPNGQGHGIEANAKSMLAASIDHIQVLALQIFLYLDVLGFKLKSLEHAVSVIEYYTLAYLWFMALAISSTAWSSLLNREICQKVFPERTAKFLSLNRRTTFTDVIKGVSDVCGPLPPDRPLWFPGSSLPESLPGDFGIDPLGLVGAQVMKIDLYNVPNSLEKIKGFIRKDLRS